MKDAAVLVPVVRCPRGDLHVVIVRRNDAGLHAGDLAFPGGKREAGDASLLETALRETREEIGLGSASIEIVERLPFEHTRGTGFRIAPFLARIERPPAWRRDEREIAEVLEARIGDLAAAAEDAPGGGAVECGPFYPIGGYRLWGASYRILRPLVPRLLAGEWTV